MYTCMCAPYASRSHTRVRYTIYITDILICAYCYIYTGPSADRGQVDGGHLYHIRRLRSSQRLPQATARNVC